MTVSAERKKVLAGDEHLLETVPDVPMWSENYAFVATDPGQGITVVLSLGRWHDNPQMMRGMSVIALPDDRAIFARNFGFSPDGKTPCSGDLRIDVVEPGRVVEYVFDGPMCMQAQSAVAAHGLQPGPLRRGQLVLRFESDFPVWDLHGEVSEDVPLEDRDVMFPAGHMEQQGRVSGHLAFADEEYRLNDVAATRDHSRGVRDFTRYQGHLWTQAQFPSGRQFNMFLGVAPRGSDVALTKACIFHEGRLYDAEAETDGVLSGGDDIWRPFSLTLQNDFLGEMKLQVRRLWHNFQFGFTVPADLFWGTQPYGRDADQFWAVEQSVEWECDGETGFGHLERGSRDHVVDEKWLAMSAPDLIAESNPASARRS
jgi:hypothetical protein